MKIRTVSDLSARLREELAWRRKEIITFRTLVASSEAGKRDAVLRGAVAVLYAHWEGFVKAGARNYLTYVKFQRLNLGNLADAFVALAARGHLHSLQESRKAVHHAGFVAWLLSEWPKRALLPPETAIDAQGNLSVAVFQNILAVVGIPYRTEYALREKPVIEKLLDMRNDLAHGEWRSVDSAAYEELHKQIDSLMMWLCDDIEAAALNRAYKRQKPVALGQ